MRSRRCDEARWKTLVAKGHFWLAEPMREIGTALMAKGHFSLSEPMKEIGTEMSEQTMEKLMAAAWKETEKEHRNFVAERIKRRNEKLNEAYSSNGKTRTSGSDRTTRHRQ